MHDGEKGFIATAIKVEIKIKMLELRERLVIKLESGAYELATLNFIASCDGVIKPSGEMMDL